MLKRKSNSRYGRLIAQESIQLNFYPKQVNNECSVGNFFVVNNLKWGLVFGNTQRISKELQTVYKIDGLVTIVLVQQMGVYFTFHKVPIYIT